MTEFLDGPAAGVKLMLRRAPTCLRVVRAPKGWDALASVSSGTVAEPGEWIYVYRRVGQAGMMHINARPRGKSGTFAIAQYRHVPDAPQHPALRDNQAWRTWTLANRAMMEAQAKPENLS